MYQIAMNACQNANFVPNIVFTSHRIDSILDMVTNQNCGGRLRHLHCTPQCASLAERACEKTRVFHASFCLVRLAAQSSVHFTVDWLCAIAL